MRNYPEREYSQTVAPGGAGLALTLGLLESSLTDRRGCSDLTLSSWGTAPGPTTGGVEGNEPKLSCRTVVTGCACEIRGGGDDVGFVNNAPNALFP